MGSKTVAPVIRVPEPELAEPYPPVVGPGDLERYPLWYPLTRAATREERQANAWEAIRTGVAARWKDHGPTYYRGRVLGWAETYRDIGEIARLWEEWDLIRETRDLETRLHEGLRFLGLTLWSESQEARDLRHRDPVRYDQADSLWVLLLTQYEWKRRELEIRGVPYRAMVYDPEGYPY